MSEMSEMSEIDHENLVNPGPRPLGTKTVGPLGFGCWRLVGDDLQAATHRIETALDLGMTLIDNADVYGLDWGGSAFGESEALLGQVLAAHPHLRDRMVLASKGGIVPGIPYLSSTGYIHTAVDASLRRLNTEHIDLYQIHRPDMFTHPAETAAALDALVAAGKIGMVGISNHTQAQEEALRRFLKAPLVSVQSEYSLAHLHPLRDGTLDRCMINTTAFLAWSPLAGGRLAGRRTSDRSTSAYSTANESAEHIRPTLIAQLDALAARENTDRAAIAVAFVLAHPAAPIALIGAQSTQHMQAVRMALGVCLTRADVYALIEAAEGIALP